MNDCVFIIFVLEGNRHVYFAFMLDIYYKDSIFSSRKFPIITIDCAHLIYEKGAVMWIIIIEDTSSANQAITY